MWSKVLCLRKQLNGRDQALNHRPSNVNSNMPTAITLPVTLSLPEAKPYVVICLLTFYSRPVSRSGPQKAEETKPKKPVVVLSLDTSKAKPREAKVLSVLRRPLEDY